MAAGGPGVDIPTDPRTRIVALMSLGEILTCQGEYPVAQGLMEEALALAHASGDLHWAAWVLLHLGVVAGWHGDNSRSEAFTREALELAREHNERLVPLLLNNVGASLENKGDLDGAEALYLESEQLARHQGNTFLVAIAHESLGEVALDRGDAARAARLLRESLRLMRGAQFYIAGSLEALGRAQAAMGADASAARLFGMAAALFDELGAARPGDVHVWYGKAVAEVRARMGDVAYEAAFAAGREADREVEVPNLFEGEESGAGS